MFRKPKYPTSGEVRTHITLLEGDEEAEYDVIASWDGSPPEPDVNFAGDFEVTDVKMPNPPSPAYTGNLLDIMPDDEIERLTERVQEQVASDNDPDNYGDYLYEQEKDRRMGL